MNRADSTGDSPADGLMLTTPQKIRKPHLGTLRQRTLKAILRTIVLRFVVKQDAKPYLDVRINYTLIVLLSCERQKDISEAIMGVPSRMNPDGFLDVIMYWECREPCMQPAPQHVV